MLVVSRCKGESLMIGDEIEVQVVEIRGDKIRLGVTCPPHVSVHRREILDLIGRMSHEETHEPQRPNEP